MQTIIKEGYCHKCKTLTRIDEITKFHKNEPKFQEYKGKEIYGPGANEIILDLVLAESALTSAKSLSGIWERRCEDYGQLICQQDEEILHQKAKVKWLTNVLAPTVAIAALSTFALLALLFGGL